MGQTNFSQQGGGEYSLLRELSNGAVVVDSTGEAHFLKEYSYTSQEAYQQAFVNFSKKLPEKHQHILYLQRTNTKVENTFCSTFYKISLLYEYLDHTLQLEIQQRNQEHKVFDEKEVWSVLCSCVLGISEMIRVEGRCHAALTPKDIRLNQDGLVKVLSLEMVGLDSDHDFSKEGTTRQLAVTILNCLLMQEITNDSQQFLLDVVDQLECTNEMKTILRLMLKTESKFIELEDYLFRMVQEETDSLNSYSNTPNLKEQNNLRDNSYSKIPEESKEDQSLHPMPRDVEDQGEEGPVAPETEEEEIPDQNDSLNESSKESQQNTLRQSNTPQLSRNESPVSNKFTITSQEHSLFTDPKLLNLIHSDLQQIKKRKSVANSRKINCSESKITGEKSQSKILQVNPLNMSQTVNKFGSIYKNQSTLKLEKEEFKSITVANTGSMPSISKENHSQSSSNLREELQHSRTTGNVRAESEQVTWKGEINSSNPERAPQKRYENIMEMEDMGFKKNKAAKVKDEKEESRVAPSISASNVASTIVYNSIQSNTIEEKDPQQSRVSKNELQFVSETYIRGRYEGTKLNGMRQGKGVFYYNQGGKYVGEWRQNKMFGRGVLYYPNNEIAYDGEWKNDQLSGKGTLYNEEILPLHRTFDYKDWEGVDDYWIKYEGTFSDDSKNGQGRLYLSNGQIFQGTFKDDMVSGEGVLMRRDGSKVRGLWRQNKLVRIYS